MGHRVDRSSGPTRWRGVDAHLERSGGRAVFVACHRAVRWPLTDDAAAAAEVIGKMKHADRATTIEVDTRGATARPSWPAATPCWRCATTLRCSRWRRRADRRAQYDAKVAGGRVVPAAASAWRSSPTAPARAAPPGPTSAPRRSPSRSCSASSAEPRRWPPRCTTCPTHGAHAGSPRTFRPAALGQPRADRGDSRRRAAVECNPTVTVGVLRTCRTRRSSARRSATSTTRSSRLRQGTFHPPRTRASGSTAYLPTTR